MKEKIEINIRHLDKIQQMSLQLLSHTSFLGNEEHDLTERIYNSLRKIIICTHFSNRQIIAVTGMQGVGKTTLMKNFYGLPDSLFNISLNRSEKLPVLITEESSCEEPQMKITKIVNVNKAYEIQQIQVTSEESFIEASKGDDSNVMYLELIVPFKYTHNPATSFMLLPGFENRGDYWEELIDFSAKCSDTALFLLDSMRIAREENHKKLVELKERFGDNLIYVITKSDKTTDNNEQAKNQLVGITDADPNRIVCAGAYATVEENNIWIDKLISTINAYASDPQITRNYCSQYICNEIQNNTRPIILELKNLLRNDNGEMITNQLQNSSWLNTFDKKTARIRAEYKRALEANISQSRQDSIRYIQDHFQNQNGLSNIRRAIIGVTPKDIIESQKLVENAVFANGKIKAVNACVDATVSLSNYLEANNDTRNNLLEMSYENLEEALVLTEDAPAILNNVKFLLDKKNNGQLLEGTSAKKAIEAVAEFGTCYYCSQESAHIPNAGCISLAESHLTATSVLSSATDAKKFGVAMLGALGVDILDGEADAVKYMAGAFAISSEAAAIGLGAVAVLGAGVAIARDIARLGREDMVSCQNAVHAIYDSIVDSCINNYDEYMSRIRDRVESKLIDNMTDQRTALDRYNANCLIVQIENELRDFLNDVRGESYGLASAFRRTVPMAD